MVMVGSLLRGRARSYRDPAQQLTRSSRLVGVVVRPLRPVDVVRPFELDRSGPSLDERRLHHHALQVGAGEAHGDVTDLAALARIPAQTALLPGADDVLDIRVRAGLAELVVEG